jgi:hypothetical protein
MQIAASDDMLICMRTTLNLDDRLVKDVKARAVEQGRTFTSLVEEALRALIDERETPAAHRIELPTWAGGGLLPGVDLDDHDGLRDVLEADDDAGYRSWAGNADS